LPISSPWKRKRCKTLSDSGTNGRGAFSPPERGMSILFLKPILSIVILLLTVLFEIL
jgi:hypothetical protein